jgi:DNA-binding MarR family transcriptional regulator
LNSNTLAGDVVHKFLTINRYLRQHARHMSGQGIRPREFAVLHFLHQSGPATVGQVQAYLYRSPGTTSMLISQLEETGYLTRTRSTQDNRVVIVELTSAGRDLVKNMSPGGILLLRQRLYDLPAERLQRLDEALEELMRLMEVTVIDE